MLPFFAIQGLFMNKVYLSLLFFLCSLSYAQKYQLPEIYQDVLIRGETIQKGIRDCADRYAAIEPILKTLPKQFKSLDIGASQGYFSFRMAHDYQARCTMLEDAYTTTSQIWQTGDYLKYLVEKNAYPNSFLLQQKFYAEELQSLASFEQFDIVLALSVIHHMKKFPEESNDAYKEVINSLFLLAPVVIIENPINTGFHTQYIRALLQEKKGKIIHRSIRGTLTYEIYLFDTRIDFSSRRLPDISKTTFQKFNGTYANIKEYYE